MLKPVSHSVMFHHFHNEKHLPAQGSINQETLKEIILWLQKNFCLIPASEYKSKFDSGDLSDFDVCLSFDDALKCQYDVALPVLEEFNLNAFFFIYSSALTEEPDFLEIYRFFRTSAFKEIDDFYLKFFDCVKSLGIKIYLDQFNTFKKKQYLSEFPFYSDNDKWFRFIRDQYLGNLNYKKIMNKMMEEMNFDVDEAKRNLWMSAEDIKKLSIKNNIIGLHSHSHPTQMSKLSKKDQEKEYLENSRYLSEITSGQIKAMSHPCGNYNKDTLSILKKMGIEIGFRSNMSIREITSPLEIPREDHTNILKKIIK